MTLKSTLTFLAVILFIAWLLPAEAASGEKFADEANAAFIDIEADSREVSNEATKLVRYLRHPTQTAVQNHKRKLTVIKNRVNEMAESVNLVHQHRTEMYLWQAQLTTRLIQKLDRLSDDVGAAIRFVDENEGTLFHPRYRSLVDDIEGQASGISSTIDTYLENVEETTGELPVAS